MAADRDRMIRDRAYEIWVEGGRQDGKADEHWEQAVHEVTARAHAAKPSETSPAPASAGEAGKKDRSATAKPPKEKSAKPAGSSTAAKKDPKSKAPKSKAPKPKADGNAKSGEPKPRAKK